MRAKSEPTPSGEGIWSILKVQDEEKVALTKFLNSDPLFTKCALKDQPFVTSQRVTSAACPVLVRTPWQGEGYC